MFSIWLHRILNIVDGCYKIFLISIIFKVFWFFLRILIFDYVIIWQEILYPSSRISGIRIPGKWKWISGRIPDTKKGRISGATLIIYFKNISEIHSVNITSTRKMTEQTVFSDLIVDFKCFLINNCTEYTLLPFVWCWL